MLRIISIFKELNYKLSFLLFSTLSISILVYLLTYNNHHIISYSLNLTLLSLILVLTSLIDYKLKIIPNEFIIIGIIIRLLFYIYYIFSSMVDLKAIFIFDILGMILCSGIFLISNLIKKDSAGFGDVKLFAIVGLFLGLTRSFNVLFYSITASFICAIVMLISKKMNRNDSLPIAPFVLIGYIIAILLGM